MPNLVSDTVKALTSLIEKDSNENLMNTIPDNLWANVMRCSMENKNLLSQAGAMYVGTGETIQVVTGDKDADGNYIPQQVAKTMALLPPTDAKAQARVLSPDTNAKGAMRWKLLKDILTQEDINPFLPKVPDVNPFQLGGKLIIDVTANDTDWPLATETNAPGKYCKIINLNGIENFTTTGLVYVQLMMAGQNNRWTIVNSTIDITATQVFVYSNIQFTGKILIFSIG